jgi:hypothetical protein
MQIVIRTLPVVYICFKFKGILVSRPSFACRRGLGHINNHFMLDPKRFRYKHGLRKKHLSLAYVRSVGK